jgi:hypothetical protein
MNVISGESVWAHILKNENLECVELEKRKKFKIEAAKQ